MATRTKSKPAKKSAPAKGLGLGKIERVILFVKDFNRAVDFYSKTLELPLRYSEHGWAEFDTKGVVLCLHEGRETTPASHEPEVSFRVESLDRTLEILKAKGIEVAPINSPCGGLRVTHFRDLEGNCIGLEGK